MLYYDRTDKFRQYEDRDTKWSGMKRFSIVLDSNHIHEIKSISYETILHVRAAGKKFKMNDERVNSKKQKYAA